MVERPARPRLKGTDIAARRAIERRDGIRTGVDNTFASPVLQQPISLGADIVVHSTTKYINGHCDALGGAVITDDESLFAELKFFQNAIGAVPGPQDCFLILRGLKTLPLRMARHCENARGVVEYLQSNAQIARIHYPDFGAMVSFEIDASVDDTIDFTKRLKLWTLAESLGGVKSLFCHPPTMTHASVEPEVRRKVGIADGLIRLSVGLEDVRDLIDDLAQAIEAIAPRRAACAG